MEIDPLDVDSAVDGGGAGSKDVEAVDGGSSNMIVEGANEMVVAYGGQSNVDNTIPAPVVGMEFSSWVDIEEYYKKYGKQGGFGVVRSSGAYIQGSKERRSLTWTCESYGRFQRRRSKKKRTVTDSVVDDDEAEFDATLSKKCDCHVKICASVNKLGRWVIRKAVNEHKNHDPLSRSKVHYIHMYRKGNLTSRVGRQLLNDTAVGVPLAQIHNSLAEQCGGVAELGLSQRDLRVKVAYHDPGKTEEVKRFEKLMGLFEDICWNASKYEENVSLVTDFLNTLSLKVAENNAEFGSVKVAENNAEFGSVKVAENNAEFGSVAACSTKDPLVTCNVAGGATPASDDAGLITNAHQGPTTIPTNQDDELLHSSISVLLMHMVNFPRGHPS